MLHLATQMARYRFAALLAVFGSVLGGAALVTGTGVLAESGLRSHLPAGRLGGADIVVSANQTFHPPGDMPLALPERAPIDAGLVDRLAHIPGVTAAVGDLSFPAALIDARGRVVPVDDPATAGHGWASTALLPGSRVSGSPPQGPNEMAVDADTAATAGIRPGDQVRAVVRGQSAAYRVSAIVATATATGAEGSNGSPGAGIFFADPTARHLDGRDSGLRSGTVDLIGLQVTPGARSAVEKAVRAQVNDRKSTQNNDQGLIVAAGPAIGDAVAPEATADRSLLITLAGSLAGVILLIVGFVVAGALGVSLSGQRRELALLRAVGATPGQIRRLAAAQATVISALAVVPGVAFGYLLAGQFRHLLVHLAILPAGLPLTLSLIPALAAILLLAIVVQVSARGASWRSSRRPATEAVAESRSEPRSPSRIRTQAGLLLIVAATVLSVAPLMARSEIGAAGTSMAGIIAAIGLSLAGPALVRRVSAELVRRLPRRASAATWLAVANVNGYALRVAGAVATLALAVVFVLTYTLAQTTVMAATAKDLGTGTLARTSIAAPGLGGLPNDVLARVRATPGVRAAAAVTTTTVLWRYQQFGDEEVESEPAMILTPGAPAVLDLDVRAGRLSDLIGNTVAVGSDVARSRHAAVGRTVSLILGDGAQVNARVVAVYGRSLGFGPVVISHDLAAGHTSTGLDQSILVRTDGGARAHQGLASLVASHPGLIMSPTAAGSGHHGTVPAEVWINLATVLVLLGYLLLGIANKLVAATTQRRSEIAALQLIGTTPTQIRIMMRREAALIATAAIVTGLLLSAVPLALLGVGFLHRPWAAGPIWLLPVTVLTVVALAFVTIEFPTRNALRTAPALAMARPD